jgi:release factor glutamine methyltransferase
MKKNIIILNKEIADKFKNIYNHESQREQVAWWLLQALTKKSEAQLVADGEISLSPDQEKTLNLWIKQHSKELKPLQYILGSVPFCTLEILVEPPVLIPRPETEEWCFNLIKQLKQLSNKNINVLDLCSGSGCIALALAKALPEAKVLGTDISDAALKLAKKNAQFNNIKNVSFIKSDIYKKVPEKLVFDLIVANPPYITPKAWEELSPMVKKWEDKQALMANENGLAIISRIIQGAPKHLVINDEFIKLHIPQLELEIDYTQGNAIKDLMEQAGLSNVEIIKDMEGKDRVVAGGLG